MAPQALIVHKDRTAAEAETEVLASFGYRCTITGGFEEALALLDSKSPTLLLLARNSIEPFKSRSFEGWETVVAVTTSDTLEAVVRQLKVETDKSVCDLEAFTEFLAHPPPKKSPNPANMGMIGESSALKTACALMRKAARSDASILLYGESGTGKELAARAIHANSRRASGAFIAIDCAAMPENLLEAELFGYEKGAYTGAATAKPGLMEMADGGTMFLDEIGELPLQFQVKLLRTLQEKEHRRLGGTRTIKFDARIVSATSRDLHERVSEGAFRRDLLFRLDVVPIRIPPLRERHGDVRLLANWLLGIYSESDSDITKRFDHDVLNVLESYWWPGNVRELQNVVRRMCVLAEGAIIMMGDVPAKLLPMPEMSSSMFAESTAGVESCELAFSAAKTQYLNLFEALYLRSTLDRHAGNICRAAEAARVDRKTFYRLLRKHRMKPERFRQ